MLNNANYSVDILVNDKPVRKYSSNNKIFIESKIGTEYSIRIKNNSTNRILAVTSVDGLDVIGGTVANADSSGYVINGYNSLTIDGFRISDDKVAKFLFDKKNSSYAASKENGSEKNVGVIGLRIFSEKYIPGTYATNNNWYNTQYDYWNDKKQYDSTPHNPNKVWYGTTTNNPISMIDGGLSAINVSSFGDCDISFNCGNLNSATNFVNCSGQSLNSPSVSTKQVDSSVLRGFDVGTSWGNATESKVSEVTFERGSIIFTEEIYYASKDSLIEMGVPVVNEKMISFPTPFADSKYAVPPKGWTSKI